MEILASSSIKEPYTSFIQLVSNNNSPNFIVLSNFLYKETKLSSTNRRLIKLSKSYYINELSRDSAKEKFYKILNNFSDQQIFQAFFIEKYFQSIKEMKDDFESYMENKFKDKYLIELIELKSE